MRYIEIDDEWDSLALNWDRGNGQENLWLKVFVKRKYIYTAGII